MWALKYLVIFLILLGAVGYYAYNQLVPDVAILRTHYPVVIYHPEEDHGEVVIQSARPKGWISVKDVSKQALGAIIVSEDWAFFQHDGYDINQIQIVIQESWEKKKLGRGASTITQQVVKNVFLNNQRSLVRKVLELYLATKIESALKKYKILEIYINIAEMGPGIFGIGPAAKYYFSKTPSELNAKEGAFLAMLLPSPKRYSQSFRQKKLTAFARSSVEKILDKMLQAQYLTETERASMSSLNMSFEQTPEPSEENKDHAESEGEAPPAQTTEGGENPVSDVQKAREEMAKEASEAAQVPHEENTEQQEDTLSAEKKIPASP